MNNKQSNVVSSLLRYAGNKKSDLYKSIFWAIIGELFGMVPFIAIAKLIEKIYLYEATFKTVIYITLIALLGQILKGTFTLYSTVISHKATYHILKNIRSNIAEKMLSVPMGVMIDTPIGTFKNIMVDTVSKLEDSMAHFMPEITSSVISPAFFLILIFVLDYRMGFASLLTIPLGMLGYIGMMKDYQIRSKTYAKAQNDMNSTLVEYVNGIEVIKAFNQSTASYEKFSNAIDFFHNSTLSWWKQSWFWSAFIQAVTPSTLLGTLPVGAYLYMNGQITLSNFIVCIILPISFIAHFIKVGKYSEQFNMVKASLGMIELFLLKDELIRPKEKVTFDNTLYRFENVSFAYDTELAVKNISFELKPNTVTALVGCSGSGKSTIAKLMAGFWDPTKGHIFYGGKKISEIPFEQLTGEISYVAQDTFLFNTSIKENIKIGKPNASDEEIIEAAKAASCHNFIMELKDGYDTKVGDGGGELSGGERQRITIARAILKQSKVIILDEATAFADPENEYLIQTAINNLIKGKTLIVVAHRLSTITHADTILVMKNGEIVESGIHDELLNQHGVYTSLWNKYVGGVDEDKEEQ
ncbi:ABC transporter ATP-binding protein [Treponema denticola]|uniref:ABC transporter ATP-binding protein n=1 Tax=Treponema denticola TaxID=158 RepID=UPI0021F8436A|nr:ABC transporter ATP-binding protein [Treponema denticola]UYT09039.1 ABC transporter ATP-binding protein/permease [Treponema denticola]